jgi:hypothetical protein
MHKCIHTYICRIYIFFRYILIVIYIRIIQIYLNTFIYILMYICGYTYMYLCILGIIDRNSNMYACGCIYRFIIFDIIRVIRSSHPVMINQNQVYSQKKIKKVKKTMKKQILKITWILKIMKVKNFKK